MLLKIYELFLKLYPERYQEKYAREMLQTMRDIISHESKTRSAIVLLKDILITPLNAGEQYIIYFSENRHVTPKTVVSLVALFLLLPFFLSIVMDEVTEFVSGGHLYNTWLWSRPVLLVWIVLLPLLSLTISLLIYILSLIRQARKDKKITPLSKRYWLVFVTIILSLGILVIVVFHDSTHCWFSKTEISNVLTCTESGILGGDQH